MANLALDFGKAAILSMDLQTAIVGIYTKDQPDFVTRVADVLRGARVNGVRVIHVQVGFRPRLPEVNPRNQLFGAIKTSLQWQQVFAGSAGAIHPEVAPIDEEVVIIKHRVSAFWGTDLDMVLRANDIDTLILLGIATSGVVLSTLLDASDADYNLAVVSDCCADQDPELHACLIEKVFARRASIMTAQEVVDLMQSARKTGEK
jgi:nicotinamidase-related amidase